MKHKRQVFAGVVIAMSVASVALAAWMAAGTGTANAMSSLMPTGNQPTATVPLSGNDVTVSWAESVIGTTPVQGYIVTRYNALLESQTVLSDCDGTVAALTCTENNVPDGVWQYSVTPKQAAWLGTEGAKSTAVTVLTGPLDVTDPNAPEFTDSTPTSPSSDPMPVINGTAEADSEVNLYTDSTCSSAVAGTGDAVGGTFGISVSVTANNSTTYWATATDAAGNDSDCSTDSFTYVHDDVAPNPPTLTSTIPASPANNNSPKIVGSAESGSRVRLYTDTGCTTEVTTTPATAHAADLAGGITVGVLDNTTTSFYAKATDAAGNTSLCSQTLASNGSVTYVEDSAGPSAPTALATAPSSPANNNSPQVRGISASDVASVRIYTDSSCTAPAQVGSDTKAVFTSPGIQITTPVADNSTTTFYARAFDAAGNGSGCSTGVSYVEDSTAPTLTSLEMFDSSPTTRDGRVDKVVAKFNESLLSSTDTAAWELLNVPSSGTLSSVSVSGNEVTLNITPGTTVKNTAVGDFTVELFASAIGIRDAAGNPASFDADNPTDQAAPVAVDVQTTNSGVAGKLTTGDKVILTYSETMSQTSILSSWTGLNAEVTVEASKQNRITVFNESTNAVLPFGTVNLDKNFVTGSAGSTEVTFTDSVLERNDSVISITLGTANVPAARGLATITANGTLTWNPAGTATDLFNIQWLSNTATESGTADVDF